MKILIISGGSSGIGLATTKMALDVFDGVYVLDVQALEYAHPKLHFIRCDVADALQVEHAIAQITQAPISSLHLFLCAGILESNRLENSSIERMQAVVHINLLGALYILKAVLPYMQKYQCGNIVLTGSDQSLVGKSGNALYGATKAAIAQLAKSLAIENASYNIRVNCVCPGTIDTPFYQNASEAYAIRHGLDVNAIRSGLAKEQPVGRIGTAEEVAELVMFLLSDQARFMTGAIIPIDGGYTAQ